MALPKRSPSFKLLLAVAIAVVGGSMAVLNLHLMPVRAASPLRVSASVPYWDQDRAVASFQKHVGQIDYLSLFWYTLDQQSTIVPFQDARIDPAVVAFAHQHHVKVLALVANLPDEKNTTWDWRRVETLIKDPAAKKAFIAQALNLMNTQHFDGLTLDFELLHENQKDALTAFVRDVAKAFHQQHKLLRVSVERRQSNDHTDAKDWAAIAKVADQLAIMAYDEHWDTGKPGPVASAPWVERTLRFARSLKLPMKKVSLGVALYGYDWPKKNDGSYAPAASVQYRDIRLILMHNAVTSGFNRNAFSPWLRYQTNGQTHLVWFENNRSITRKLQLAKKYGVGNVYLWRLGQEDTAIWQTLSSR